ncbi:disease resistance protein RPV1-like isoform X2 [Argentina anserina]|uniref:disease resistance protein RPV1-like isoform X2 n=1 Tax=Argentina anserina TaxID=57926 RepID=UPI002176852B|nr:disease resistance protein RPV1-like isoform X2 [Potentilla anserina]
MDLVKADQEASSSKAYQSRRSYHVFLSFRGEETRNTFTDHLYSALVNAGFHTFRDEDELERGEGIRPELEKAIQQSRSSVIVFSKDYASSTWCLDELVMILEHKRTSDHVVLPVFYDVDPSDVRKQSGSVAMAFARHETKQSPEKLIQWRAALTEVSNLAGMVLQDQADRHESNFIKKIVNVIEAKLINPTPFSVTPYLIGFDHQVNTINLWLQDKYSDVGQCRILVLKGVGGVGKTTIAKVVYNSNFIRFEASSFLESIREISEQPNGLVQLQRQFLSNILNGRKLKIHSVSEGLKKIQDHVSSKSVLLVLDDVDHTDQLDALLGMEGYFCSRSKIIITTRRAGLLKLYNNVKEYPIETLNPPQSLELFSWHAFGWICPWYSYTELSKRVVEHTEGLPLALQILGSSLRGQMVDVWESQLQKLEAIPSNEILNRLRISYDSLEDDHDKNLFLHIACFFIGKSKDVIIRLLDECGFYTIVGIQNLIDRCLVTIDRDNKVMMHKMIRDMGRGIVHLESRYPEKRSRIWHHKDSLSVLRKKNGSETIEGLILDTHKLALETNAFTRMRGLIFLQLSGVDVIGSYEAFPERLRWLCWLEFPSSFIPISFPLRSLVVLEMQYSKLRQFSKGSKSFPSLKYLDLSHSKDLTEIGDFLMLPNLEKLIIEDCANLLKVHKSIVNLEKLDYLNMRDCKKIRKLPKNINKLKLLEVLIISGCSSLSKFPVEIGMMESLKALEANNISIGRLLAPIGKVKLWPGKSVNNFWFPSGIVQLRLRNCNLCDDIFPRDFGNLASLRYMDLGGNAISSLPDCIRNLSGLDCLDFGFCKNLKSLEGLPGVSEAIDATFCESLEKITFQSISCMPKKIEMFNFRSKLREIQFWFKIVSIEDEKEMIKILGLCNLECKEKIRMCTPDLSDGWNTDRPIQDSRCQHIREFYDRTDASFNYYQSNSCNGR